MVPVAIAAYFIFGFNLLDLGLPLVAFFAVLVLTSWSLGLISAGVILRYGLGAEELAWSLAFLLLPLCCVYYPVSVLPDWLQVDCACACRPPMCSKACARSFCTTPSTRTSCGGRSG